MYVPSAQLFRKTFTKLYFGVLKTRSFGCHELSRAAKSDLYNKCRFNVFVELDWEITFAALKVLVGIVTLLISSVSYSYWNVYIE